ncbi:putative galacturonosyltransferase 7 [Camellia lanceoleosa]|uniref:Galacturonosyltransferase 7 n=1 Tax=Camellia lanceoleosa TaxID=1840588 RepID=A0ACC0GSC4_9ERIC|nr:putative galacturonosyltransferase 7 [Camellia lanceoleosa]
MPVLDLRITELFLLVCLGLTVPTDVLKPRPKANSTGIGVTVEVTEYMKDDMVKKLKDQLYVARAYYPSIAKLPVHDKLSHAMKQNIPEFERVLSETTTDADLPLHEVTAICL